MEHCDLCNLDFKNKAGLAGHNQLFHSKDSTKATLEVLQALRQEVNEIKNQKNGQEVEHMSNTDGYCAECHKKDLELLEQRHKMEKAQEEASAAKEAAKAAAEHKPATEWPSLETVIAHCESGQCKQHADQLAAYKGKIVTAALAGVNPAQTREFMKKFKIDEAPSRIVIPEAVLGRGMRK